MSSKSNWISNKLKNFDFLGEGITFRIHKEPHLKTVCGGVLRVILYLMAIFLAFFFGNDFIGKKNPQIYFELKNSLETMNLTYHANEFFFAVRFENSLGKSIDVSDYFHIKATHNHYINNKAVYTLKSKDIPMVLCSNITFDKETEKFFQKVNKTQFFCPLIKKDSEITISGNFEDLEGDVTSINLHFDLCLNIENNANQNCRNYNKLFNEYLNNEELLVGFIIKDVRFEKDDFKDPFKHNWFASYSLMSKNMVTRDQVYLTKTELHQDDGFFFSSNEKYEDYGYSNRKHDFYYTDKIDNDDDVTKMNNEYYSLEILVDTKYGYYTRKYMKLQDVLALLVSFFNLLISITRGIYAFYYRFRLRSYFFKKLVRIPPDQGTVDLKTNINKFKQNSELSERPLNINKSPKDFNQKSFVNNMGSFSISPINENENSLENNINNNSYKEISKNSDENPKTRIKAFLAKIKQRNTAKNPALDNFKIEKVYDSFRMEKKTNSFSFWDYLKISCYKRNPNNCKDYLKSEEYSKLFLHKFDIFYYLEKMKNLSLMKKLLLKENELNMLNFLSNKYYTWDDGKNNQNEIKSDSKETFEKNVKYLVENKDKTQICKLLWEELGLN